MPSERYDRYVIICFFREDFNDDAMDFLTRALDLNPDTRITVEEALEHPLFYDIVD